MPTAIKTISDLLIEPIKSPEKLSLPASKFFLTNSDKPGSNIGISPFSSLLNFSLSLSKKIILPRSEKQKIYVDALKNHKVVMALGPAGTGKTFLAVAVAVTFLLE